MSSTGGTAWPGAPPSSPLGGASCTASTPRTTRTTTRGPGAQETRRRRSPRFGACPLLFLKVRASTVKPGASTTDFEMRHNAVTPPTMSRLKTNKYPSSSDNSLTAKRGRDENCSTRYRAVSENPSHNWIKSPPASSRITLPTSPSCKREPIRTRAGSSYFGGRQQSEDVGKQRCPGRKSSYSSYILRMKMTQPNGFLRRST